MVLITVLKSSNTLAFGEAAWRLYGFSVYYFSKLFVNQKLFFKKKDFQGGPVVGNPPVKAGDMGSSPALGRTHMPQSTEAHAPQLLSLCSKAHVPRLLKPAHPELELCNKSSHCNEKPARRSEEQHLLTATEKSLCGKETQCSQNKQINLIKTKNSSSVNL